MSDTKEDPRPVEPVEPDLDECCGSGCMPCVFDRYEDRRQDWKQAVREWEERHPEEKQ